MDNEHTLSLTKVYPEKAILKKKTALPRRIRTMFPQKNISDLKPKIITSSLACLIISVVSIIVTLIENLSFERGDHHISEYRLYLRLCLFGLSLIQIFFLIHYWTLRGKINDGYEEYYANSGVFLGNNYKKLVVFEFTLAMIAQPYTFDTILYKSEFTYITFSDMISVLILFKCYFLFKFLYDSSYYNSYRAQWIT